MNRREREGGRGSMESEIKLVEEGGGGEYIAFITDICYLRILILFLIFFAGLGKACELLTRDQISKCTLSLNRLT